jgi:hypothetical protein
MERRRRFRFSSPGALSLEARLALHSTHGAGATERLLGTATEAGSVIYVNQDQLDQVKYLLQQSAQGNHLLFDEKTLRRIAPRIGQQETRSERVEKAEHLLEQMILRPSISSKRAFLEALDPELYDEVARVYFNIVQNTAQENQGFSH